MHWLSDATRERPVERSAGFGPTSRRPDRQPDLDPLAPLEGNERDRVAADEPPDAGQQPLRLRHVDRL